MEGRWRLLAAASAASILAALGTSVAMTPAATTGGTVTFSSTPGVARLLTHYVVSPDDRSQASAARANAATSGGLTAQSEAETALRSSGEALREKTRLLEILNRTGAVLAARGLVDGRLSGTPMLLLLTAVGAAAYGAFLWLGGRMALWPAHAALFRRLAGLRRAAGDGAE